MKKKILCMGTLLLVCLCNFFILVACSDKNGEEEQNPTNPYLQIDNATINFEETGSSITVPIKANTQWTCIVPSDAGWCNATKQGNSLVITVTDNDQKGIRRTTLEVKAGTITKEIKVSQLGWGKAILVSKTTLNTGAAGGDIAIEVTTNVDYVPTFSDSWVKQKTTRAGHPVKTTQLDLTVEPNQGASRTTVVKISDKDNTEELEPVSVTILQKGLDYYEALDADSIKEDIQVKVTGGKASSFQPGSDIDKSFDGDMNSIYHSNWSNSGANYFPITLEYYFEGGTDMDYFIYYPRTTGSNGHFKAVTIDIKTNATRSGSEEWVKVMDYDFGGKGIAKKVEFPQAQIGVTAVRFTIHSGSGDGQGFATCAEMQFFKKNPKAFDYSTLFTDASCSELKPGITEQEISACPYSFFKNIAFFMFHKKYGKEFRINTFKAYPHPDLDASLNKTGPYSLLDNPTGISVDAGAELIVLANDIQGQDISIKVQNLDKPGGDGFGGISYPISTGLNKLRMQTKGLVYVMYHTPNYATAPRIKLHFASGKVNGYYDSQDAALKDRASELLSKAVDQYFDVVGQYAHLTFPTARYKNHTKDLKALIEAYDQIAYNEMHLMGLVKYNKMFRNRMYLHVMYTSYMYATSYHTAYNDNTLGDLCDETKVASSACWGPAHEIGHVNQTRPGLKWLGTTEVTNNIMSEYIQTTVFGQGSRLQVEDMGDAVSPNRYSKAWNSIVVDGISHAEEGDVFCKLVPFWQLELYFGKVLGRTPLQQSDHGGFYPDVYEYVRTHADMPTPGDQQLEFVYIASLAAKMDLTDFFEKWGFLKPVDITVDDYGTGQMTVTEAKATAVKERVKALNYPKPNVALEYINDNNYSVFKNQGAVQAGTASRSGDRLTFTNWKNVIAYEVREGNADGRLICVSDGVLTPSATASFSIRGGWKDTYKVYAVSYDNQRIQVTLSN